jgi:23S rRNA (guanosine2251-2'-O)-methyltransferase
MSQRRRPEAAPPPPRSARPGRPKDARGHTQAGPEQRPLPQPPRREAAPAPRNALTALPPVRGERLEGRNVVLDALERGRRTVRKVWLDANAKPDRKVSAILAQAGTRVERVDRALLDRMSVTGVHNGVIAEADPLPELSVKELLDAHAEPFLVLVDEVQYEHNLGAILRSALGAGVDGVIVPVQRGKGLTPVVHRVSMGGAEAVPLVREGISSALAQLRRAGVTILGADMDGVPPWELDLTGPVALVLGGEDKGLTDPVRARCDHIVGVPLAGGLESLNVSVTAGVLLFERVRQRAARSAAAAPSSQDD